MASSLRIYIKCYTKQEPNIIHTSSFVTVNQEMKKISYVRLMKMFPFYASCCTFLAAYIALDLYITTDFRSPQSHQSTSRASTCKSAHPLLTSIPRGFAQFNRQASLSMNLTRVDSSMFASRSRISYVALPARSR